jgi:hypothetical protein
MLLPGRDFKAPPGGGMNDHPTTLQVWHGCDSFVSVLAVGVCQIFLPK